MDNDNVGQSLNLDENAWFKELKAQLLQLHL
jgi:hypothetical protein